MGHLSIEMGQSDSDIDSSTIIEWRRSKVLELSSCGYSQREIAQTLKVSKSVVNRDVIFLRQQAQENLQHHIHEVVPEEYQKCMVGMKQNLKHVLEIGQAATDPKISWKQGE